MSYVGVLDHDFLNLFFHKQRVKFTKHMPIQIDSLQYLTKSELPEHKFLARIVLYHEHYV